MTNRPVRRAESGSALLVTLLLLALMGLTGFAALEAVTRDQQVAGFVNQHRVAFYAAEAGVVEAVDTLQVNATPTVGGGSLGDASIYPDGQPSFSLDPAAPTPIEDLGIAPVSGMNLAIGGGGPTFNIHYFRVRVRGQAPGGSSARLEVAAGALLGT